MGYSSTQQEVIDLIKKAEPKENLKKWVKGYVPKNYKRISIDMKTAMRFAEIGAFESMVNFGTRLFFTQAMLLGAVLSEEYKTFYVITPSQYGKSFVCSQMAILLANKGKKINVSAMTEPLSKKIMEYVISNLQNADSEILRKLLVTDNKVEKLRTSTAKNKISFSKGGDIIQVALGGSSSDPKKNNNAIGQSGGWIVDESDLISDEVFKELGRRTFSDKNGNGKELMFQISNPHYGGRFYKKMNDYNLPKDTMVVWLDVRTALEESNYNSIDDILESEFFENDSSCKEYLLCELDDSGTSSMFGDIVEDNEEYREDGLLSIGIDSAYKGKDGISLTVVGEKKVDDEIKLKIYKNVNLKHGKWIDGVTSYQIIEDVINIVENLKVKTITVDIGYGVWLLEGLASYFENSGVVVMGVNFGEGTTKERQKINNYSAKRGLNKRAEMYLDMADLISHKKLLGTSDVIAQLKEQMNATKLEETSNNKKKIIDKKFIKSKIGKSPDELDSTVLAIYGILMYNIFNDEFIYS